MSRFSVEDKVWPVGASQSLNSAVVASLNVSFLEEEGAFKAPSEVVNVLGDGWYRVRLPSGYTMNMYEQELDSKRQM